MGKPKQISKEDLIRAAKKQLLKKGQSKITLKNVAEQAGVTQGVVYYHFKTKDQLLKSLLQHYLEDVVPEELKPFQKDNSLEGLKIYLKEKAYEVQTKSEQQQLLFELVGLSLHHREMRSVMGKIMQERVKELEDFIERDKVGGRILRAVLDGLALQALFDPTFNEKDTFNYVYEYFLKRAKE